MSSEQPDMRLDALLRRAMIPKGHRPRTASDVDKLLDMIDAEPMSDEQKQRMLRKINGQDPMFPERVVEPPEAAAELSEAEHELAAMYRAQNKPLPPDLAAKVQAMEERAANRPKPEEGPQSV